MPLSTEQIYRRIMRDYLPHYYGDFPVVQAMMRANAAEFVCIDAAIRDVFDQWFIDTATWSIKRWEELYGIKTSADTNLTIEERRAAVKVLMQSKRVMSKRDIKEAFAIYNGMEVEVTEYNPTYSVEIKFTDMRGVPGNLPEIMGQMASLLPAHLAVIYAFSWFLWRELDAKNIAWENLDAAGITYDDMEVWA